MKRMTDPEWRVLEVKILAWDERIRNREHQIQQLDEKLHDLQERLGALKRRLAVGTGVMASVPDPTELD